MTSVTREAEVLASDCSVTFKEDTLQDDDSEPTLARGLYRVVVLFGCLGLFSYFLLEMYSTTAALSRLASAAKNFRYIERCDAEGNPKTTGEPNCVNLYGYLFINGPVLRAIKRVCLNNGEAPVMLTLEEGKASKRDIVSVERRLSNQEQNGARQRC
ncbi:MAG: hypothetical protein EOP14_05605 [Pseudomonas sp.]|nr:MAG: hypothetical protein EOP14_05605 [Pseudomonas sp.]